MKHTIAIIALTAGLTIAQSASAQSWKTDYQGFWGFTALGCGDENNQYRAVIGRWELDSKTGKLVFGKGREKVGFYDSNCAISNKRITSDGAIEFDADCTGEEGKKLRGKVVLKMENEISMRIATPVTRPGLVLHRCEKP